MVARGSVSFASGRMTEAAREELRPKPLRWSMRWEYFLPSLMIF